jgi:predicted nucleic acid binding AN1-type Zn finger protein
MSKALHDNPPTTKKKKVVKRCSFETCKRKLKLTDMGCRCKNRYCQQHRLPESHFCEFNFKNETAEAFMKRVGLGGGEPCKMEVI